MPIQVYINVTEYWFESKQIWAKSHSLGTAGDAVMGTVNPGVALTNFLILKILVISKIDHIKKTCGNLSLLKLCYC